MKWAGSWACVQQIPDERYALPPEHLTDTTLRQIVQLTLGGKAIRLRLSNAFGSEPLRIQAVHIARALDVETGTIGANTDRPILFSGRPDVLIPAGADYLSDPLAEELPAFCDLAMSIHLKAPPNPMTGHPGARQTSFLAHGNRVSALEFPSFRQMHQWYLISAIDVLSSNDSAAVATLGDSMTDGRGSTTNGNNRWPNNLARRFHARPETRHLSVLNAAAGGNRLLLDGIGPNALARLDRDVFALTGLRFLIVLEGINDIGMATIDGEIDDDEHQKLVRQIIGAYEQIIARAHAKGVKVMGGTLVPFVGSEYYHPGARSEADRQIVNTWIRTHFDAVADFDAAIRDPANSDRMLPIFDSGDHLDPSVEGYRAMADAVPLAFFEENDAP